jgi:hypothetical protein
MLFHSRKLKMGENGENGERAKRRARAARHARMQRTPSVAPAEPTSSAKRSVEEMLEPDMDAEACTPRRQLFRQQAQQHAEHLERLAKIACDAAHWRRLYEEEKKLRGEVQQKLEEAVNELTALRKDRLRKSARTGR